MNKIQSILLVDDDPVANFIHENLLSLLNISDEINIASNGAEALDLIHKGCISGDCPHVILLDLNMPVMNGFEIIEKFKEVELKIEHKVKIVILTSSANAKDIDRAKALKIEDYMVKPLNEQKIKEKLMAY